MADSDPFKLLDTGREFSYLSRCVALVTLLMEHGILDELLETGRITNEDLDKRVAALETHYPGFKTLGCVAVPGTEK